MAAIFDLTNMTTTRFFQVEGSIINRFLTPKNLIKVVLLMLLVLIVLKLWLHIDLTGGHLGFVKYGEYKNKIWHHKYLHYIYKPTNSWFTFVSNAISDTIIELYWSERRPYWICPKWLPQIELKTVDNINWLPMA